ncbi:ParB/RepB/Spo0J family partition protein [Asticcacaulis sp. EMRT-3]|uniref:ParB/RepB/Spo0J family partition protein n=1 Tax=Asticcacaulis sp. EMRT-3 TaxID=3040349 RepID=UPI0024AFAE39|nr:ParB/RepB/Spo0J family partition protein [Asticcacaulis sp. EMRT-3]MDI7776584.1 ParB/RepB/Spo0J family partition protein [Asticcacaulis sp. EMRT-3]
MTLDLSALDDPLEISTGKPLQVLLSDIEEDPNQPRVEFDEDAMADMEASIRAKGVISPVSIRPHPQKLGKYLLNFGARRLRGSRRAGRDTIPAFIDEGHDDFDQVIENEQRENLKPIELALFIQRKLDAGAKKADIARRLGKPAPVITEHLALIDLPPSLERAYRDGRLSSPKTIYELRSLHAKFPAEVERWVAKPVEITRATVSNLAAALKAPPLTAPLVMTKDSEAMEVAPKPSNKATAKVPAFAAPQPIKRPKILVEHKSRPATLILDRRPPLPGMVYIRYDTDPDSKDVQVEADTVTLSQIIEDETGNS